MDESGITRLKLSSHILSFTAAYLTMPVLTVLFSFGFVKDITIIVYAALIFIFFLTTWWIYLIILCILVLLREKIERLPLLWSFGMFCGSFFVWFGSLAFDVERLNPLGLKLAVIINAVIFCFYYFLICLARLKYRIENKVKNRRR